MYQTDIQPSTPSASAEPLPASTSHESTTTSELPGSAGPVDAVARALRITLGVALLVALTLAVFATIGLATVYAAVAVGGMASLGVWLAGVVLIAASTRLLWTGASFDDNKLIPFRWALPRD